MHFKCSSIENLFQHHSNYLGTFTFPPHTNDERRRCGQVLPLVLVTRSRLQNLLRRGWGDWNRSDRSAGEPFLIISTAVLVNRFSLFPLLLTIPA